MRVDITDRLADLHIEIGQETATRHLAAIEAELKSPSPIPVRRVRRRRRPAVMLAIIALVVLTAAGAFAAENAVQGEPLYPVKQVTEWAQTWLDPTVPADHRIEELESLIERRATHEAITDQLQRAEDAVADVADTDAVLVDRLDRARDRIVDVETDDTPHLDHPASDDPPESEGTDRPSDTTLPPPERPGDGDRDEEKGTGETLEEGPAAVPPLCHKAAASIERGETVPRWILRACRAYLPETGHGTTDSP
ncbi:MAG: hypothetical protein BMS9Abin07_1796 [Acidimicrobiia bacterium]|nr:MAG: hypothetical protein BMS9Abin07_1796 [Acidimicrobiia bacterium]